jgi:hypothetical protein
VLLSWCRRAGLPFCVRGLGRMVPVIGSWNGQRREGKRDLVNDYEEGSSY